MRVLIAGAGAMGSMFGAFLAKAGHDVHLVDLWDEHIDRINDGGLTMSHDSDAITVRASGLHDFNEVPEVDLAMVWCKSFATEDVIRACRAAITPATIVCTLQNGLGNAATLKRHVDPDRVVYGVTSIGAKFLGPAHIEVTDGAWHASAPTYIGGHTAAAQRAATEVAETLSQAGIQTEARADIDSFVWYKLAAAVGMSSVSFLTDESVGEVLDNPESLGLVDDLTREIVAVANALSIPIDADEAIARNHDTYRKSREHSASMRQDLQNRRQTEVDALSGAVAREGERTGIPTPVASTITRLIRARERAYLAVA